MNKKSNAVNAQKELTIPKPYATVKDESTECLSHGGVRRRGGFAVIIGKRCVWTENDTWQPLATAEELSRKLAGLLNQAYKAGATNGGRTV